MADWTAKLGLPTGRRSHLRATALSALAALVVLAVPLVASSSSAAPAPRAFQAPRDCFQPLDRTNALTLDPIRDTAKL